MLSEREIYLGSEKTYGYIYDWPGYFKKETLRFALPVDFLIMRERIFLLSDQVGPEKIILSIR